MKRVFDLVFATAGLILLSPFLAGIGFLVRFHDGGPVFYKARRVGIAGREFDLLKFRTMVINADKIGAGITTKRDSRVTPVGRFLRKSKLDELPQLINVVRGEMSLVGPRPEDPRYVALYTIEQREVLSVRPGITSAASVKYRHEAELLAGPDWESSYRHEVLPAKLKIDLNYIRNRTLWTDIQLILRTFRSMAQSRTE